VLPLARERATTTRKPGSRIFRRWPAIRGSP
jgi:hypothetical protein